jgi:hypothetical protein
LRLCRKWPLAKGSRLRPLSQWSRSRPPNDFFVGVPPADVDVSLLALSTQQAERGSVGACSDTCFRLLTVSRPILRFS